MAIINGELWFSRDIMKEFLLEKVPAQSRLPEKASLSYREKEILLLMTTGMSNAEISDNSGSTTNCQYAVAENICAGGVYLRIFEPLKLHTKVKVEIFLPMQEYMLSMYKSISLIKLSGKVVRKDHCGMAVEFDKDYSISPLLCY